jgi:hypothetical protein
MRTRSPRVVVGLVAGAAVLVVGLALSAPAPAHRVAHVALTPRSARPGQTVTVRGHGFRPRLEGTVVLGGRRIARFRANAQGSFRVRFVLPAGTTGGRVICEQEIGGRGVLRRAIRAWAGLRVMAPAPGAVPLEVTGIAGAPSVLAAPGPGPIPGGGSTTSGSTGGSAGGWWAPPQHLTWYWQLQGAVNNGEPVAAYDIDGFDNGAGEVAALHARGKRVICYVDVGTYEPGRPDSGSFPASVLGGGVEGWPGERWLEISNLSVLEPIMTARFRMCREKGFDAVEPDNMDGYSNVTGFPLTAQEQLAYDEWVAGEVHALGMSVFQKNDGEQTSQLVSHFDGALDEQCNQYSECSDFQAYLSAGKPVLDAEYSLSASVFCAADNAAGIMGARFDLDLSGSTFEPCW